MLDKLVEALERFAFNDGFDTNRVNFDDEPAPDRLYVITKTHIIHDAEGTRVVTDLDALSEEQRASVGYWTAIIDLDVEVDASADIAAMAEKMYADAMTEKPEA